MEEKEKTGVDKMPKEKETETEKPEEKPEEKPVIKQYFPQGMVGFDFKTELASLSVFAENTNEVWRLLSVVLQIPEIAEKMGYVKGKDVELKNKAVS